MSVQELPSPFCRYLHPDCSGEVKPTAMVRRPIEMRLSFSIQTMQQATQVCIRDARGDRRGLKVTNIPPNGHLRDITDQCSFDARTGTLTLPAGATGQFYIQYKTDSESLGGSVQHQSKDQKAEGPWYRRFLPRY